MYKVRKHIKHKCRLRKVNEDILNKLYLKVNHQCINCVNDCKNYKNDHEGCKNRVQRESLNELIQMILEQQINLKKFARDYNLKLNILLDMLNGRCILSYKYYTCLCHRLRIQDEYAKYEKNFSMEDSKDIEEEKVGIL